LIQFWIGKFRESIALHNDDIVNNTAVQNLIGIENMMSNKFVGTLLLSAIAITASTAALAKKPENLWGLGLGAVISDQSYIGVSNEVTPVPRGQRSYELHIRYMVQSVSPKSTTFTDSPKEFGPGVKNLATKWSGLVAWARG
jgi:hypothetical protein